MPEAALIPAPVAGEEREKMGYTKACDRLDVAILAAEFELARLARDRPDYNQAGLDCPLANARGTLKNSRASVPMLEARRTEVQALTDRIRRGLR